MTPLSINCVIACVRNFTVVDPNLVVYTLYYVTSADQHGRGQIWGQIPPDRFSRGWAGSGYNCAFNGCAQ